MVFTRKFSEFVPGTVDETVGLTTGANTIGPSGGGGGSGSVIQVITQDTSALTVGHWVRFDNATQLYVHGLATTSEFAEIEGVVKSKTATTFELQQCGYIASGTPGFSGFSTTGVYFLSDLATGQQTLTPPTTNGHIRLPLFVADSTDSGWVCSLKTGVVIGTPGPIPNGGGGGGDSSIHVVDQGGNTFQVGDWVRVTGDLVYSKASGANFDASQSVGVVIGNGDPLFTLQFSGFNSGAITGAVDAVGAPIAITSGTVYYLSDVSPGKITPVKPTNFFTSVKPCFISESSSTNTGYILPQRPLENEPGEEDSSVIVINQTGHGFIKEDVVRVSGANTYTKALADSLTNARAVGIVINKIDDDNFILQTSGFTSVFSGKTGGSMYWLSAVTPGLLTNVEPSTAGLVSKPMFIAVNATSGYILEQRPMLQPNANGGSSGSLSGNVIQNFVSASEVTGAGVPSVICATTITPSSNTSRVFVQVNAAVSTGGPSRTIYLYRNGVQIAVAGKNVNVNYISAAGANSATINYIDSPATNLPVTYTIGNPTTTLHINTFNAYDVSTVILQEIGP